MHMNVEEVHEQPMKVGVTHKVVYGLLTDQEYYGPPHCGHDFLHGRGDLDHAALLVDHLLPGALPKATKFDIRVGYIGGCSIYVKGRLEVA